MSKHTPGPWEIITAKYGLGDVGIKAPGVSNIIAECFEDMRFDGERNKEEALANAHLIAAAPDLLSMLKHAVRWHDQLTKNDIEKMEAAITKAEGRT